MIPSSSRKLRLGTLACAGVFAATSAARASQPFVSSIESYWKLDGVPVSGQGCKLCHSSDLGGTGTVVQPFGKTMQGQGLKPEDLASLYTALGNVTKHAFVAPIIDSDGDGVADYAEIVVDHTNPNDPKSFVPPAPPSTSNGGEGGAEQTGSEPGDSGGQSSRTPAPPVFEPPSAGKLPPPFVHGCELAPGRSLDGAAIAALLVAGLLGGRRARRRARGPS